MCGAHCSKNGVDRFSAFNIDYNAIAKAGGVGGLTRTWVVSHVQAGDKERERTVVELSETPLRLDSGTAFVTLYAETTFFRHVKNLAEGKFIVYCQRAGQSVAALPAKMVEILRTVANYESYLRDLRKTLYEAYYRRTLDHGVAERLTQAAFDRFKLPKILSE